MSLDNSTEKTDLPNLTIYSRYAPSQIEASIYEPVICLILQGSKTTAIGDQQVTLHPGDALLVSHHLPVVSRITEASADCPYMALILSLDLAIVRSLYEQVAKAAEVKQESKPLTAAPADPAWLDPLTRYLKLMNNAMDAKVLGPAILREIHYRLLTSPIGQTLRRQLAFDSHASRIARAIGKLRSDFRAPLSVQALAESAGMSPSSFHAHFKSVTGTTPLQYQKDLRLIEARSLLVEQDQSVSQAAFAVGYESPTHFSRDYSRKFGLAPSKDVRSALPQAEGVTALAV